ncbi:MAG: DUF4258 domain-containing protein [Synechocystis sp.]|nr:DUF4258 domain-containing protein [Synechocystis sp.]
MIDDMRVKVCKAAKKRLLYLPHTIQQMSRPERMISTAEVNSVVWTGDIIEDYPDVPRGHSCLILGFGENERAIHVVCAPKDEYLAIITAYLPDPRQWMPDFKGRR